MLGKRDKRTEIVAYQKTGRVTCAGEPVVVYFNRQSREHTSVLNGTRLVRMQGVLTRLWNGPWNQRPPCLYGME